LSRVLIYIEKRTNKVEQEICLVKYLVSLAGKVFKENLPHSMDYYQRGFDENAIV
jgi:hypothetical protein